MKVAIEKIAKTDFAIWIHTAPPRQYNAKCKGSDLSPERCDKVTKCCDIESFFHPSYARSLGYTKLSVVRSSPLKWKIVPTREVNGDDDEARRLNAALNACHAMRASHPLCIMITLISFRAAALMGF